MPQRPFTSPLIKAEPSSHGRDHTGRQSAAASYGLIKGHARMVSLQSNPAAPRILPTIGLLASALISGFYWLPLRHLQSFGFQGVIAAAIIAVLAALPLVPPLLRRRSRADWHDLARIGLLVGGGYAL